MESNKNKRLFLRVTEKEYSYLQEKLEHSNCKNMSEFLRKLICNGAIIHVDTSEIHEVKRLMLTMAKNINQIALRTNFQGTVYREDIDEIKVKVDEIYSMIYKLYSYFHN